MLYKLTTGPNAGRKVVPYVNSAVEAPISSQTVVRKRKPEKEPRTNELYSTLRTVLKVDQVTLPNTYTGVYMKHS